MVSFLLPHKAGGHTHLCAEHFKQWRRGEYTGYQSKTPPHMELWMCLGDIEHHMWPTGYIPPELVWAVLVLIIKVTTNTR